MKEGEDTLAFLLNLNLELAALECKGQTIIAPGLPGFVPNPKDFATDDCIEPPGLNCAL
jgi:hypothetical protein